jgi:hypothetical protein
MLFLFRDESEGCQQNERHETASILGLYRQQCCSKALAKFGSLSLQPSGDLKQEAEELDQEEEKKDNILELEEEDSSDAASDEEVRHEEHAREDGSSGSSWGEEDHCENYSGWEVLKNEYAEDFGFDYSERDMCR